jgi:hypothetical protein
MYSPRVHVVYRVVEQQRKPPVPDTKKYWKLNQTPRSGTDRLKELQTRIACKGKTASEVLDEMSRALSEAEARQMDPLIVLEDLAQVQDSVATLIKGLSRLVVGYPRTVTFWESSGYTEAFLSAMEKPER